MEDRIVFQDLKIDFQKLLQIGFVKEKDYYIYETKIMNRQFSFVIKIDKNRVVWSDVIEFSTGEKFMLYYVPSATGEFVGKIREEYNHIIEKVKCTCCSKGVFQSEYAHLIIEYIRQKYHDELEYLWEKFPNNAIWRNKDNNKWYGILLIVEKSKLGIEEEGCVEIIDLLLEPERLEKLVDHEKYFAGYHMNKKHWITILLDGSVPIHEIYELIDNSYYLSKNK